MYIFVLLFFIFILLFRKKLLETVEFIKKYVNIPQISQLKMPAIQCQKEMIIDVQEKEHKILNNLPKVGVCELYDTSFFV